MRKQVNPRRSSRLAGPPIPDSVSKQVPYTNKKVNGITLDQPFGPSPVSSGLGAPPLSPSSPQPTKKRNTRKKKPPSSTRPPSSSPRKPSSSTRPPSSSTRRKSQRRRLSTPPSPSQPPLSPSYVRPDYVSIYPGSDNHANGEQAKKQTSKNRSQIKENKKYKEIRDIISQIISYFHTVLDTYRNFISVSESRIKISKTERYYNELINLFNIEEYYQLPFNNIISKIMSYDFSDSFKSHLIICTYLHYYIDNYDKLSLLGNKPLDKNLTSIKECIDTIIYYHKDDMIKIIEYKQEKDNIYYNKDFFKSLNKVYQDDPSNKINIYILYLLHNYYTDNLILNKLIIFPPPDFTPKKRDNNEAIEKPEENEAKEANEANQLTSPT